MILNVSSLLIIVNNLVKYNAESFKLILGGISLKNTFFYDTDIGKIWITESDMSITGVYFHKQIEMKDYEIKETVLLKDAGNQLQEYFVGKRKKFVLPFKPTGTEFQKKVWRALQTIPYSETRSYGEVAKMIENPKAVRAIGMANNRNPISIFIPCHRVIGADGKLVGYGGGLDIKKYLLNLERGNKEN